jgi:hypothetical protein
MTARCTLAALSAGLVVAALPAVALGGGRPNGMSPAAYHALVAQGQALNAHYGNAVTRLTAQQFAELWRDGGSKLNAEALNAMVTRSQAMNEAAAEQLHGLPAGAYTALEAEGKALNDRYGNAVTRLTAQQFAELWRDGGSKLSPEALNALIVRSQKMNGIPPASDTLPVATSGPSFAWDDFGIGVAAAIGVVLLIGGIGVATRSSRRTRVAARIG